MKDRAFYWVLDAATTLETLRTWGAGLSLLCPSNKQAPGSFLWKDRRPICVCGGDGGESNSPSRRGPTRIYYRLSRLFASRPAGPLPTESPRR